jgi:hypothetical protein
MGIASKLGATLGLAFALGCTSVTGLDDLRFEGTGASAGAGTGGSVAQGGAPSGGGGAGGTGGGVGGRASYVETVLSDTPLAYWRLGEANPGVDMGHDEVGSHHGVYTLVSSVPGALANEPNAAGGFPVGGRMVVPDAVTGDFGFGGGAAFTLEVWVWVDSGVSGMDRNILSRYMSTPPAHGYELYVNDSNGSTSFKIVNDTLAETVAYVAPMDAWYHLVVVVDESVMRMFINGSKVDELFADFTLAEQPPQRDFILASTSGGSASLSGRLDEVAVYASALDEATILAHYCVGSKACP